MQTTMECSVMIINQSMTTIINKFTFRLQFNRYIVDYKNQHDRITLERFLQINSELKIIGIFSLLLHSIKLLKIAN